MSMYDIHFVEEMRALLGDQLPAFLDALEQPSTRALRVNALRPAAYAHCLPYMGDPVPWCGDGYYIREGARPGASAAHNFGAMYLQEASAMTAAAALAPAPGERILDLCAAPGGKSTQIAAAMRGAGVLVSNEIVPSRAKLLRENLERMGVTNAVAVCAAPDLLARQWPGMFDAVLVDAPCSGEGMFRRTPEARGEWKPESPQGCARRQAEILDSAAEMVRSGGRLVYSTCTFNRHEDEGSVARFLERHADFAPEDFSLPGLGASEGGMLRVWPHLARGDGHFVARLRRAPGRAREPAPMQASKELVSLLERFRDEVGAPPDGTPIRQGDYVHLLPHGTPSLDGIRTVKPGLALMRTGRSHIEPLPAFARAAGVAPNRTMEIDDALMERLRAGEKPKLTGPAPGWTLLEWQGLPVAYRKIGKEA